MAVIAIQNNYEDAVPDWPEPRAAYIHVPFCRHRCGYCNFSVVSERDDLAEAYLEGLTNELSRLECPHQVDTLFIGGGTPTHLAGPQLERLLATVLEWFPLDPGAEFSVEGNPADVDDERVRILARHGVTRISLGGQSFDAKKLAILERDHRPAGVARAVELARERIGSVSLDLIFATPGETLDVWRADLAAALKLRPDHLSTYGLTYERGTAYWSRRARGQLSPVDEEMELAMYAEAIDTLSSAGFEHYEVSNFARAGHRCRHNEVYWNADEYHAAGPGAARYIGGRRETNHKSTTTWLKRVLAGQSPVAECEALSAEDKAREALVLGLRRLEGIDRVAFARRWHRDLDDLVGQSLERLVGLGLIDDSHGRVRLTRKGLFVSDSIWPDFLTC